MKKVIMNNKAKLILIAVASLVGGNSFATEYFSDKTITKIYTYATQNTVVFRFTPSQNNMSCVKKNYAAIDTSTAAGKQAFSALITARSTGKKVSFRGNKCSNVWKEVNSMTKIYRIDY